MLKVIPTLTPVFHDISLNIVMNVYQSLAVFLNNCKTQKATCPQGNACFVYHEKRLK